MAAGMGRICVQSILKLVNSVVGMTGIAMVLYSLWMLRVWLRQIDASGAGNIYATLPWLIYTLFGLGVFFCLIACSGHVAAETSNGHCLFCYMVFVFLLLVLEAAVTADIFLNEHWEEDFPEDRTGKFHELEEFVKSNFDICKWIALVVVGAQALSIILAMVLRALGPNRESYYDSDDDYTAARLPLLANQVQYPPYTYNDGRVVTKNDSWNMRNNELVN